MKRTSHSSAAANEPRPLLRSTGFLLARVGAASRRRFARVLGTLDLKMSDYGLLTVLADRGPISQRTLAADVGIDPRNLVLLLDGLEARTLVSRTASADDRRVRTVAVTARGRALLGRLRHAGERAEAELLADLDAGERRQLHALLLRLLARAGDDGE